MSRPEGKYAWSVTVGTKGQIVIPKEAREIFNINPGDTIMLFGDKKRGIAIPPKSSMSSFFEKIFSAGNTDKGVK